MFVTSLGCHEIGRWRLSGPVLCTLAKAHDVLGVQKLLRYVRYRQMDPIGTRFVYICEGTVSFN